METEATTGPEPTGPVERQVAELGGGGVCVVKKGDEYVVEKPKWGKNHVEVVNSLEVDEMDSKQEAMISSTLDFFNQTTTTTAE